MGNRRRKNKNNHGISSKRGEMKNMADREGKNPLKSNQGEKQWHAVSRLEGKKKGEEET